MIVPGLGLLLASVLATGASALGLSVVGAIITTVGLTLLYQDQTDHYASWAYAWTLIPMSVGAAFVAHGWRVGRPDFVAIGTRVAAIFGAIFVVGWLYFEATFRDERAPFRNGRQLAARDHRRRRDRHPAHAVPAGSPQGRRTGVTATSRVPAALVDSLEMCALIRGSSAG